jgi:Mycothiol maleylpyruvate isomerase N-terminal domain
MTDLADAFLVAATSAADLLADHAVAESWDKPSALADFSVRGLAGHLAQQVLNVPDVITADAPDRAPVTLEEHYGRVTWRGADINNETNTGIRTGGEAKAQVGPAALVAEVRAAIERLRTLLPDVDGARPVFLSWSGSTLTADDFLTTRMMEIAVHSDDLAVSVGVATPTLPVRVMHPVYDLLFVLALRRHGQTAVLRALSRAERAPANISAL